MKPSSMNRRVAILSSVLALSALLGACATVSSPQPMAGVIASDPELSTLNELIKKAGIGQDLNAQGPLTVFAPSNAAFKAVPAKTLEELGRQPQALKEVLTYHVASGKLTAAEIKNGKIKTLQGGTVEVSKAGDFVTIEAAAVTRADITATNGVIHVIDTVLLPPKK